MLDLARLRLPAALLTLAGAVGCATQLHDAYVPPEIPQTIGLQGTGGGRNPPRHPE